ncbi:MAG: energy-coupling factor transporter transmembrane protein EcfT [Hyphomicrobiales bacterium]|nr:energy-coupling factor transporter transmembrane protein EcfT [Hyphomicrobiales bacterium]
MLALYIHRDSPIHRTPVRVKLAALFAVGVGIALLKLVWALAALVAAIFGLYALARLPARAILTALKPVLFVAAIIFGLQWALVGPLAAVLALLRILCLVLLASLVTFTTPLSAMIDAIAAMAAPLSRFGLSPAKLGLVIALTLRFIPVLMNDYREIEAARRARGARYPGLGAAGPLLIKTLRMTDALGDAIAARGFENRP